MSSVTLSPIMHLPIPTVGQEPGPDYASDVNQALTILDQHNHTPGSGNAITPAGLNINADLSMINNSLTNTKAVSFTPQVSVTSVLSVYVAPGGETPSINDLWYNDSAGNPIQITKQGLVNATLASLAGESYSAGTFFWKQGAGSTTPANFDIGAITLRPNIAATTYGTTIQPNASLTSAYTLTLPNNPSSLPGNSFLTLDAAGNLTAGPTVAAGLDYTNLKPLANILGSQLSPTANIQGTQIADHTITAQQLAPSAVKNLQSVTITYTQNFTVPAGVTTLLVSGAGGGGGGAPGGGSGGTAAPFGQYAITVTPGQVITATVGGGGGQNADGAYSSFSSAIFFGGQGAAMAVGRGGNSAYSMGGAVGATGAYTGGNGGPGGNGGGGGAGGSGGGAGGPGGPGATFSDGFGGYYTNPSGAPGAGGAGGNGIIIISWVG